MYIMKMIKEYNLILNPHLIQNHDYDYIIYIFHQENINPFNKFELK